MWILAVLEQTSVTWHRISERWLTSSCCCQSQNPDEESQACQSSDAQLHGYCVRCFRGSLQKLNVGSGSCRLLISLDQTSRFYTTKRGTRAKRPNGSPPHGWKGRTWVSLVYRFPFFVISSWHCWADKGIHWLIHWLQLLYSNFKVFF